LQTRCYINTQRHLTIVGGVRERPVCPRRGRGKTVCARGAWWALLGGPSTSPLDRTDMRASVLFVAVLGCGVVGLCHADPPQLDTETPAWALRRLTTAEVIRIALSEAQRRNLDLRDVVAESAASHATPAGTAWYVYFQRKADYRCSFIIAIDDRTGRAEPDIRKCG
jgi:hypothetical protein